MPAIRSRVGTSWLLPLLAAGLLALVAGCGDDGPVNPPTNEPPNGVIDSPDEDLAILSGESINFAGTGSDVDGNITTFTWSFPGGNPSSSALEDPGSVTFDSAGVHVVTFSVVDNNGAIDPTPDERTISVSPSRLVEIDVFDFFFQPVMVNARVGDTIRFTQRGEIPHTATSGEPGAPDAGTVFDLGLEETGDVEDFTPTEAGTTPYFCRPHPFMTGSIVIAP